MSLHQTLDWITGELETWTSPEVLREKTVIDLVDPHERKPCPLRR